MLIAQLSDLHFCGEGRLAAKNHYAERAFEALSRLRSRPDVVILTGDVTEHGTPAEYDLLLRALRGLDVPVYAIPGNHDAREAMRTALGSCGYLPAAGPLDYVVETRPVRLIGLDSVIPGGVEGALTQASLDFLEEALGRDPDVPTLVFLHHPPILTGLDSKDEIGLCTGAERLAAILSRHSRVERLVSGHFHRFFEARFGGTVCQVAPPIRYLSPEEREEEGSPQTDPEQPGYLVHRWIEGGGLVTHLHYLPR
jgi:3',5'-cyclic AMP phosphodiesterase CpdA